MYGKPVSGVVNRVAIAPWGGTTLELVQPVSGKSIQTDYLEKHGEGINHVGFAVDDVDKEAAILEQMGFKVISRAKHNGLTVFVYMDTDKVGGIVFELMRRG